MKKISVGCLGKVRVTGPGIEHGILSTYQSRFICETKGAGREFKHFQLIK
jgi:hypothetical protein